MNQRNNQRRIHSFKPNTLTSVVVAFGAIWARIKVMTNLALLFCSLFLSFIATAQDVSFPKQTEKAGKILVLNGTGIRKATIFGVKVYYGALYLEKKSSSANEILGSTEFKQIRMHFVHDVDSGKIRETFHDGFLANCASNCAELAPSTHELESMMGDMKDGDDLQFDFTPEAVHYSFRGKLRGAVARPGYSKVFLGTWLGAKPPTEDLKKGLLGSP